MIHFIVWPKTTINYEAIASGILDMVTAMDDNYQTALALGMLPAPLMAILEKQLKEKLLACCCKNHDMEPTKENMAMFSLEKERFSALIREITVHILHARPVKLA